MNYKTLRSLSKSELDRLKEIDSAILELQRERSKILRNKAIMFEEERDYLASKIPDGDFYVNGRSTRHRNVVMNRRYTALWTGVRMAATNAIFHRSKIPDDASDEQIQILREEIIRQIDWLDANVIQKGLLWC